MEDTNRWAYCHQYLYHITLKNPLLDTKFKFLGLEISSQQTVTRKKTPAAGIGPHALLSYKSIEPPFPPTTPPPPCTDLFPSSSRSPDPNLKLIEKKDLRIRECRGNYTFIPGGSKTSECKKKDTQKRSFEIETF